MTTTILELFKQLKQSENKNKRSVDFYEVEEQHKLSVLNNWFRNEFIINNEIIYYTVQSGDDFIYFNYYITSIRKEVERLEEMYNIFLEKSKTNKIRYEDTVKSYKQSIEKLKEKITY